MDNLLLTYYEPLPICKYKYTYATRHPNNQIKDRHKQP